MCCVCFGVPLPFFLCPRSCFLPLPSLTLFLTVTYVLPVDASFTLYALTLLSLTCTCYLTHAHTHAMQMLDRDLEEAEEQYGMAVRAHMMGGWQ